MFSNYIGTKVIKAEPAKHTTTGVDGYNVIYEDGYQSWSPKETFEEAYHQFSGMSFGHALVLLKRGYRMQRDGWNGRGIFIELQVPDEFSKMTHPYIFIDTTGLQSDNVHAPRNRVPWLASQTDMLADDWRVV